MLHITKNTTNVLFSTAAQETDKTFFAFRIRHQQSNITTYFSAEDVSDNPLLYCKFNIIETGATSVVLSAGTLSLQPGVYNYSIADADAQEYSFTGTVVDRGLLFVSGTTDYYSDGTMSGTGRTIKNLGLIS